MIEIPYKFHGTIGRWRVPWIIGVLLLILSMYLNRPLYHLYIYFFIAGIITIPVEKSGWGELSGTGLLLRFGIFNLSKIFIKWSDINKVTTDIKIHKLIRIGAGAIPAGKGFSTKSIAIKFKSTIPKDIQKSVKRFRLRMLFGQSFDIKGNDTLILDAEPDCGASAFYKILSSFTTVDKSIVNDDKAVCTNKRKNRLGIFDAILFIIPIIIILYGEKIS